MTQDVSDNSQNLPGEEAVLTETATWTGTSSSQSDASVTEEIAQLREQILRLQADYTNLVRRTREESLQLGEWTENKTILKFLPILDNLERSLEHIPTELATHVWIEWIRSIVKSMQKIIADFWIHRMDCIGNEVDPDLHDVISQIPHETTTIQTEIEKGYLRWTKALRHAKVIVGDGSQKNHA